MIKRAYSNYEQIVASDRLETDMDILLCNT